MKTNIDFETKYYIDRLKVEIKMMETDLNYKKQCLNNELLALKQPIPKPFGFLTK